MTQKHDLVRFVDSQVFNIDAIPSVIKAQVGKAFEKREGVVLIPVNVNNSHWVELLLT